MPREELERMRAALPKGEVRARHLQLASGIISG